MAAEPAPLLSLRGWSLARRGTGGATALLAGLDLTLRPGDWVAVAGANGSGKSSLLSFLAGPESPLRVPAALLPQDPDDQFVAATVGGELALGREGGAPAAPPGFGLEGRLDSDPRLLSAGQKQRLALAIALGTRPRVLLCDEPTALQDARQAAWVLDRLDAWRRESGGALLTATCDRREAERADRLLVLADGRVAAAGPPGELLGGDACRDLFAAEGPAGLRGNAGVTARARAAAGPAARDAPVLALRGVACRFGDGGGFAGVDLELAPGARLGVCGDNGCGKSTLLAACAGARRPDAGEVRLGGRALYARGALDTGHGLALLAPQFPEYLFSRSRVAAEIAADPALADVSPGDFLAGLGLPGDLADCHPRDLSSGQRRRLALGLVLRSGRALLLVDEPTVALDGPGRRLVRELLAATPPQAAVVVASHDHRFLEAIGCEIRELGPRGLGSA